MASRTEAASRAIPLAREATKLPRPRLIQGKTVCPPRSQEWFALH